MSDVAYTEAELREFNDLTWRQSAPGMGNMDRPIARTQLRAFIEKHGKPKCDAMWAEIRRRENKTAAPILGSSQ